MTDTVTNNTADAILAALTAAGLPVTGQQIEADSIDIHIDGQLVSDHAATALSWRPDGHGWYLLPIDSIEGDGHASPEYLADGTPQQIAGWLAELLDHTPVPAAAAPSALLADPEQVAVVRDLITYARSVHAVHFTYAFENHLGHPITEQEHVWTVGSDRVSFEDGLLTYRRNGVELLKAHVPNARQVAQLLAAVGVLPERFIGGGAR